MFSAVCWEAKGKRLGGVNEPSELLPCRKGEEREGEGRREEGDGEEERERERDRERQTDRQTGQTCVKVREGV